MQLRQQRLIALAGFFGAISLLIISMAVFDVWLADHWGLDATISRSMRNLPPILVFAWGFFTGGVIIGLACHFWWSNPGDNKGSNP